MSVPFCPGSPLTEDAIWRFHIAGVITLEQIVELNWMGLVGSGIEGRGPMLSVIGKFMSRKIEGYQMDNVLWVRVDFLCALSRSRVL